MKATIEFDRELYRQLKIEAARRGQTIRELVSEGVRRVLGLPTPGEIERAEGRREWFGRLRAYAENAGDAHDLSAMRASINRGREAPNE